MKLLFLLSRDSTLNQMGRFYDFLPYRFGPYSFTADRDLYGLQSSGWIIGETELSISPDMQTAIASEISSLSPSLITGIRKVVVRSEEWSDNRLIDYVYKNYPAYTALSERKGVHLKRATGKIAVHTIGYEDMSIDGFLDALIAYGIRAILDVRANPISRKYGFAKKLLSARCNNIGVIYKHLPELGVPSSERKSLGTRDSYETLFTKYEVTTRTTKSSSLAAAAQIIKQSPTALLCFEREPSQCHRSILARLLAPLAALPINHLETSAWARNLRS
jgi:uncharacterized protein (DUF488 family)